MAGAAVASTVGTDLANGLVSGDLVRQIGQDRCIANTGPGHFDGADFQRFRGYSKVNLAPLPRLRWSGLLCAPLAVAFRLDPGAVDQQVQSPGALAMGNCNGQPFLAARQSLSDDDRIARQTLTLCFCACLTTKPVSTFVGHALACCNPAPVSRARPVEPGQSSPANSRRLATMPVTWRVVIVLEPWRINDDQAEQRPQRQTGLDRSIGKHRLPPALAGWRGQPLRLGAKPDRQRTALPESCPRHRARTNGAAMAR